MIFENMKEYENEKNEVHQNIEKYRCIYIYFRLGSLGGLRLIA
jgi:hypothetical protein